MDLIPPGYSSFSHCVYLRMPKISLREQACSQHFGEDGSFGCMYIYMHVCVYPLYQQSFKLNETHSSGKTNATPMMVFNTNNLEHLAISLPVILLVKMNIKKKEVTYENIWTHPVR